MKTKLHALYLRTLFKIEKIWKSTYPIRRILYLRKINDRSIPKNEFDRSLDIDLSLVLKLNKTDYNLYMKNLMWRRNRAHEKC